MLLCPLGAEIKLNLYAGYYIWLLLLQAEKYAEATEGLVRWGNSEKKKWETSFTLSSHSSNLSSIKTYNNMNIKYLYY